MEYMEFYYKFTSELIGQIDECLEDDVFTFETRISLAVGRIVGLSREDGAIFLVYTNDKKEHTKDELIDFDTHDLNIIYDLLRIESKRTKENDQRNETGISTFWPIGDDTHGTPALVESLTDIPVFFQSLEDYSIVPVNCNIDLFADKMGHFVVYAEDYELAMWQVYAHDTLNILAE